MNSINMTLVKVNGKTRQDLLDALSELATMDADFSGENGVEYLWDRVWKANGFESLEDYVEKNEYSSDDDEDESDLDSKSYEYDEYGDIIIKYNSNMEYLLDILKDIVTDKELIEKFISEWVDNDSYYLDRRLEVIYDDGGIAECIALAVMS